MSCMKMLRGVGLSVNAVYLIGWIISLVGLGLAQDWCQSHEDLLNAPGVEINLTFYANEIGKNCSHIYRFFWFILALSLVPVLLSVGRFLRPDLVGSGSSALFAVLAVLQMIATDAFVNGADSDLADAFDDVRKGSRTRASGFAIMSAMSLLAIIIESFVGQNDSCTAHAHREPGVHTGGEVKHTTTGVDAKV